MSTVYSKNALNLQWINCCVSSHDLFCSCEEPKKHLLEALFQRKEEIKVTAEEKQKITKCLITGDSRTEDTEDITDDLDALFAQDGDAGEDATG